MRTPIEEYVVNKIKKLRNEFGMSQKEFGDAINLSSGFIGDIEAGREGAKYNINHINEIEKVFKRYLHEYLTKNPI